jgi:ribosome-binding protein aMBF1 (putative translation factor)
MKSEWAGANVAKPKAEARVRAEGEEMRLIEPFCVRLPEALQARRMKAIELSRKTGIDKGTISNYLAGRYIAGQKNVSLLADALNVNPFWLIGYDVPMDWYCNGDKDDH